MHFGGLKAVDGFDLEMNEGDLVGLIGPNGAGKTTVFNVLTGVYPPTRGSIEFHGRSMVGKKPHQITACGIARTFQNIRLFGALSVFDNVRIAAHRHYEASLVSSVLQNKSWRRQEIAEAEKAEKLLEIFGLLPYKDEISTNLPYGQQRRLEIARALATDPELLLLDEPAAGMNPSETEKLMELLRWLQTEFGVTILLIEHHMQVVKGICRHILVLDYGKIICEGDFATVCSDPGVIEAYLGEEVHE
jgi:branched-chain amino acid transport system ATP-binding protein